MIRRTVHPWVLALTMSAIGLGSASIAWACTPGNYGRPSVPGQAVAPSPGPADPAPTAAPDPATASVPAASTATAPASAVATAAASPAAVSAPSTAVSGTTRGASLHRETAAAGSTTGGRPRPVARPPVAAGAPSAVTQGAGGRAPGPAALAVRNTGATAAVAHVNGRPLFRSPAAPARTKAPSPRTAHADAWAKRAPAAKPGPMAAASAQSATGGGGLAPNVLAGLLILVVGLTGVFGGALAFAVTRRRADVKARRNDER